MKLIKIEDDTVLLKENEKDMKITFLGNGDLYWVFNSENNDNKVSITKENYALYSLFEDLYNDIEDVNIFEKDDSNSDYIDSINDKEKYYKYNYANYLKLFDKDNKTIIWHSDEIAYEVSNFVKIKKCIDSFEISFFSQPSIKGYDEDFHSEGYYPIRFRNSGSRYDPFNVIFMRMYYKILKIDDVNDYGHQIHMEEYLYNKQKVLKK